MVKIRNLGPVEFRKYIENKKVIIFGAGRALDSCIDIYFQNKAIEFVVDNDSSLWGKHISFQDNSYNIFSIEKLVNTVKEGRIIDYVCFISSPFYAVEIIDQLDRRSELDGLECFLQLFIRNTKEPLKKYVFSLGKAKIPRQLHYIWLGAKKLPEEFRKNIETWKQCNPNYEIVRWDETNLTFNDCDYLHEAYECKEWGYASNYLRLKIIYEHGGIYLDTDVEAISSFDKLLNDEAFFNMGCADRINNGCGFGAVPKHEIVGKMLSYYNSIHFINANGKPLRQQGHIILNKILSSEGFQIVNQYSKNKKDVVIYPSEVMSPLTIDGFADMFSERTVSIHKESGSWKSQVEEDCQRRTVLLSRRIE